MNKWNIFSNFKIEFNFIVRILIGNGKYKVFSKTYHNTSRKQTRYNDSVQIKFRYISENINYVHINSIVNIVYYFIFYNVVSIIEWKYQIMNNVNSTLRILWVIKNNFCKNKILNFHGKKSVKTNLKKHI